MPFLGILHTLSSIDCGPKKLSFKLLMATLESPASDVAWIVKTGDSGDIDFVDFVDFLM